MTDKAVVLNGARAGRATVLALLAGLSAAAGWGARAALDGPSPPPAPVCRPAAAGGPGELAPPFAASLARSGGQRVRVGEAVPVRLESPHPFRVEEAGRPVFREVVRWPGASYLALHFSQFDLGPGVRLLISHPAGLRQVEYAGKGKDGRGSFWATHIPGDAAIVELAGEAGASGFGFVIDQVAHGFPAAERAAGGGGEAICGVDDSDWAQCYQVTEPAAYEHGRAVARLLINGVGACTGFLVGSQGHMLTNNHCITDAGDAADTDFEFGAEASCATDCSDWFACPGQVVAGSATFVDTSSECDLDYTLVQLAVDPSPRYGYLTLRPAGAVAGERMYIPGHPQGWGKRIALESTDPADPGGFCTVLGLGEARCDPNGVCGALGGPLEIGYMCDTQGGNSGSPVVRYTLDQVIALHHCASCPNRGERIQDVITDLGANVPISARATGDKFGAALAVCDFNGDGEDDLALGVAEENVGAIEDAGAINVLYGTPAATLQTLAPADQYINQSVAIGGGGVDDTAETGDRFGTALAAGNFNGDAFCDLAVGVPGEAIGATTPGAGLVNILYGSAAGLQTLAPADQAISQNSTIGGGAVEGASEAGDKFGAALAAGDFNEDGFDDLAIGAPGEDLGASLVDAGWVNVLYGGAGGLQTVAPLDEGWSQNTVDGGGAVEDSAEGSDHFGTALAAGDFSGDGSADLAIGVPDEDVGAVVDAGMVNVLYGSAAGGLQTLAPLDEAWNQNTVDGGGAVEDTAEAYDHFGKSLAVGDFNGGGVVDLAIGVPEEDIGAVADAGFVNVLYATAAATLQTVAPADEGWHQDVVDGGGAVEGVAETSDGFGFALAAADFDDNGSADLAIGVPEEDAAATDGGWVNVLYGTVGAGLQTVAPADYGFNQASAGVDEVDEAGDHLGYALAAGDFDNNGFDDLAAGARGENIAAAEDAGAVNVLYGAAGGLQTAAPLDEVWSQDASEGGGAVDDVAE